MYSLAGSIDEIPEQFNDIENREEAGKWFQAINEEFKSMEIKWILRKSPDKMAVRIHYGVMFPPAARWESP